MAHQIEIGAPSPGPVRPSSARRAAIAAAGSSVVATSFAGLGILLQRGDQLGQLMGRPGRNRRGAAHQAEQLGRRQPGPVADVGQEIAGGNDRGRRVAHVLGQHRGVVVAAALQVPGQVVVAEGVRVHRLDLPVGRDRRRLHGVVPLLQLLPPELLARTPPRRAGSVRATRLRPGASPAGRRSHARRPSPGPRTAGRRRWRSRRCRGGMRPDGSPSSSGSRGGGNERGQVPRTLPPAARRQALWRVLETSVNRLDQANASVSPSHEPFMPVTPP